MPLADTRFLGRRRALAARLAGQRIDDMLVTNLIHVRYLAGFSGSNAALRVSKDLTAAIATDGRYTTQIAAEVPDIDATITRDCAKDLLSQVPEGHRVGFEADYLSVAEFERLRDACPAGVSLVPVRGVIEEIRLIKDEVELAGLTEAAQLTVQAIDGLVASGELAAGRTEREVAADLEFRMRTLGAERTSFDTIVASGPNSAMPHYSAGERVLVDGDLVTIDFGMHRRGFNSDMTRTFVVGHATDFAAEIYDVVLRAQLAGIKAARPGTPLLDVDAACRDIINAAGYGEYFVHSTGHGVGLEVHEGPSASTSGTGDLEPGMTLTIEPGIYVPGKGGVRIEDTLVITTGAPRVITEWEKELRVV
ncbi:aminopeptidase P family protein [Corynebacterium liangguodongii]|uniref:Peptidase M24 family protein n=1 Tax=Corynebacterium liangguodongii TaxID=2079535 RepID=A0A2S0WEA1_9CORY|nr:aminopeptidase P family protein [Corynebacterium liangguodongii]AWB84096.1 peptidase M24 family protein [Corynebacterium liangguodongii]PWC00107.1 aminopeptidase P family protein [Corynebacterium liangguodongii]